MVGVPWRWKGWGKPKGKKGGKICIQFGKMKMDTVCFFFPGVFASSKIYERLDMVGNHCGFSYFFSCSYLSEVEAASSFTFLPFLFWFGVWWGGDDHNDKVLGSRCFYCRCFFVKHFWSEWLDIRFTKKNPAIVFTMNLLFVPMRAETRNSSPCCDPSNR